MLLFLFPFKKRNYQNSGLLNDVFLYYSLISHVTYFLPSDNLSGWGYHGKTARVEKRHRLNYRALRSPGIMAHPGIPGGSHNLSKVSHFLVLYGEIYDIACVFIVVVFAKSDISFDFFCKMFVFKL